MISQSWLRRVRNALLFGSICLKCALASPAVNVALKASFPSPQLLVELLETAAEENSTSYFPLLDRIADGAFKHIWSDEQLYNRFLKILVDDGHLTDPQALSSFKLAVSIHASAPRIEAQHQFYRSSVQPSLEAGGEGECGSQAWADFAGKRYCFPELDGEGVAIPKSHHEELPFDRVLGDSSSELASILYADITSDDFAKFHKAISKTAKEGKTSYRVRYKPNQADGDKELPINAYGVALDLKRTDYIVIDDRKAEEETEDTKIDAGDTNTVEVSLDHEEISDVKPLSASELVRLGLRASSFVMNSTDPLDMLLRLSQDFPKHSSAISAYNVSDAFLMEHRANREQLLPAGFNVIWINGVQMDPRKMDPFSLLDHLRRERGLIDDGKSLGLTGREVIDLLSHPSITAAQTSDEPARYDWRDEIEGGKVIIWMNDIEKDKRYADWSPALAALLQRTFPGQMPAVRRDIHNVIFPVDFTDPQHVETVVETLQSFIKRKLPVRVGLVPINTSERAAEQAKAVYHLLDTYGLVPFLEYLEKSLLKDSVRTPNSAIFESAIDGRKVKKDKIAQTLQDVLKPDEDNARIQASQSYLKRLGADGANAPIFINGVAITRNDEWLQSMSRRVTVDLRTIQQNVFEDMFEEDSWLPGHFLLDASPRRNPIVVPEDEKSIRLVNLVRIIEEHGKTFNSLRYMPSFSEDESQVPSQLLVIDNFDSDSAKDLLKGILEFRKQHPAVEVRFLHTGSYAAHTNGVAAVLSTVSDGPVSNVELERILEQTLFLMSIERIPDAEWTQLAALIKAFGLEPGKDRGLVLNGRVVGPLDADVSFGKDDLEALLAFEQKKRINPAMKAVESLGLSAKFDDATRVAMACSLVSVSTISDVPEGIFESLPTTRSNLFSVWEANETAIILGDIDTASVQLVASLDPASEIAQRWVPIFKVLSEFSGVHMRLFLNPKDRLEELPVKRFYRYVLKSQPTFGDNGVLQNLQAEFNGLPSDTLLTMAMDVPPSWLVAPKESTYDLDNIKLSSISGKESIDATYELENILIEGHSRDMTTGVPPRGTKLELGTEKDPHFADTIIMSNLGYFQFKSNPGLYKIQLQDGRSKEIFNIDSIGAMGWNPASGDESTEIALLSFQGLTLYPRMSRKPGQETEDVLKSVGTSAADVVSEGAAAVDGVLSKLGLKGMKTEKYLNQAAKLGSDLLSRAGLATDVKPNAHADINIFSVASGHLYERMLNIMMVSVMRHTNHTVKFWFIEQFLSPSFKSFLPTMAAEYGFDYEMVTYKWPHWLRGQKEKQREIWGYKILFLDVLFPLDLDKVIFVDADQIVRTDMYELVTHDLEGAPYGFTPMCDSRTEMEGFRFWKQGYWKNFLKGLPYHISALYVVDLKRFRQIAAGDRLRQQYHQLSADPNSLSNLDQDLPNNMQMNIPIHSLPQEWLWCETWCSDESLKSAKTIDLCNNPLTKEPKLDRARRQVPEWTEYDDEIAALARRTRAGGNGSNGQTEQQTASSSSSVAKTSSEHATKSSKRDEL
ncbi:UDP-glucose:glyco protein glucosyltransferase precursor [Rhizodiscina lignyota]|uniref:UDP-glucose:glyco protein glucosyltransferase n=1 Tax=Rhizodiscina lignyota TaxID=1504668 RepID=A0A9P4MBT9_9PEZI|nr:UDP-glucose:glyco protein glucosyltransferase precursor [Rhizodiscina lignyota]